MSLNQTTHLSHHCGFHPSPCTWITRCLLTGFCKSRLAFHQFLCPHFFRKIFKSNFTSLRTLLRLFIAFKIKSHILLPHCIFHPTYSCSSVVSHSPSLSAFQLQEPPFSFPQKPPAACLQTLDLVVLCLVLSLQPQLSVSFNAFLKNSFLDPADLILSSSCDKGSFPVALISEPLSPLYK